MSRRGKILGEHLALEAPGSRMDDPPGPEPPGGFQAVYLPEILINRQRPPPAAQLNSP